MSDWKGIVGKSFRPLEFHNYVSQLTLGNWRPQFVVLHNTSAPRLSQWHSTPGVQRMLNLQDYYKNQKHWSAGPHLFIADDLVWVFTPLTVPGVHSPSWNGISWGVEMVGEYEMEPFGAAVRENTLDALATLHGFAGLDPETLRFHKEDPKTTHKDCPGKNVVKADIIAALTDRMGAREEGEHFSDDLTQADASAAAVSAPAGDGTPQVDTPMLNSPPLQGNNVLEGVAAGHIILQAGDGRTGGMDAVQDALGTLGLPIDLGDNDQFLGFFGEKTENALIEFQNMYGGSCKTHVFFGNDIF